MKFKIFAVLTACTIILVASVGCGEKTASISPDVIVQNMLAAYGQSQTYSPDINMSHIDVTSSHIEANMTVWVHWEDDSVSLPGTFTTIGDVDTQNKRMSLNFSGAIPEDDGTTETFCIERAYVTDGWVYKGEPPAYSPGSVESTTLTWTKYELTDVEWLYLQETFYSYRDLFMQYAKVELIGTETVNGIECWKIEMKPDMEQLMEWLNAQGRDSLSWFPSLTEISDVKVTDWIAKDTYYEVRFALDANCEKVGAGSLVLSMSVEQSKFNIPVNITLPTEAKNAKSE